MTYDERGWSVIRMQNACKSNEINFTFESPHGDGDSWEKNLSSAIRREWNHKMTLTTFTIVSTERSIINSKIIAERNHMTATISHASQRFAASHNNNKNEIPFKRINTFTMWAVSTEHTWEWHGSMGHIFIYTFDSMKQWHTHQWLIRKFVSEMMVFDSASVAQSVYYTTQLNILTAVLGPSDHCSVSVGRNECCYSNSVTVIML